MNDIGIWKWRFQDYTIDQLREVYQRQTPGDESPAGLAAMDLLAERKVAATSSAAPDSQ